MLLSTGRAAKYLGVHEQTLRRWEREGRVHAVRVMGSQQRRFDTVELDKLMIGGKPNGVIIHYVRSSDGNTGLLNSQVRELEEEYGEPDLVIKDRASGLNDNRKGLQRMIRMARDGEVSIIRVTNADRLTRFGLGHLTMLFNVLGVEVVIKNETMLSPTEELMSDFMDLLASFSGRFYRLRSRESKLRLLDAAREAVQ